MLHLCFDPRLSRWIDVDVRREIANSLSESADETSQEIANALAKKSPFFKSSNVFSAVADLLR